MQRRPVLDAVAGPQLVRLDRGAKRVAPCGLAVVVHAVGERQDPEPAHDLRRPVERGDGLGEPAQRAGRQAAEDHAAAPGALEHRVDAVRAPRAQQAQDAAAADVDQVLREQVPFDVALDRARPLVAAEQRQMAAVGDRGEATVEPHDVVVGVAAGGRDEAHPRPRAAGDLQREVIDELVAGLHREPAAAEREDLRDPAHCATVADDRHAREQFSPSVQAICTGGPLARWRP